MPRRNAHFHQYRKFISANGKNLWRCMLPNCNHSFYGDELLIGREALCWGCGEVFKIEKKMNSSNPIPRKPVCPTCTTRRGLKYNPKAAKAKGLKLKSSSPLTPNKPEFEPTGIPLDSIEELLSKGKL